MILTVQEDILAGQMVAIKAGRLCLYKNGDGVEPVGIARKRMRAGSSIGYVKGKDTADVYAKGHFIYK